MKSPAIWTETSGRTVRAPDPGELHLWRVDLDGASTEADYFPGPLSPPEQERALRFKFAEHRRRYVHARCWLREILGAYLRIHPQAVPIQIGDNGKPYLAPGGDHPGLHFNLSHSAGFGLLAVTTGHEIGVDVQIKSAKNDWPAIAARYFTVKELNHVRALPPDDQAGVCAEIWTRKEAAGKALGIGLHSKTFAFAVGPAAWGRVHCDEKIAVWSLAVETPYAAAVAILG